MVTSWTPERRARQSELIRHWKPWAQSTGPRSAIGKSVASRNAFKGGMASQLREIRQALRAQQAMLKSLG